MEDKNKLIELPLKVTELVIENLRKNTELSLAFFQDFEKNQREFLKGSYELMNITLPFEGNLWELQTKFIEKSMNFIDEAYKKFNTFMK